MAGGEAGLSGAGVLSLAGLSLVGELIGRRAEAGVCDLVGLSDGGAGLTGAGAALLTDADDNDEDDDEGGDKHPAGRAEKEDGILRLELRPSRASSSLHTAKLRLLGSKPAVASEHLALS